MTVPADNDIGVAAAIEEFSHTGGEFGGDSRSQSLSDIDMLAGYLHLHKGYSIPVYMGSQAAPYQDPRE